MAAINFGNGSNTPSGDTVRQALEKLQARIDAFVSAPPVTPTLPVLTISAPQSAAEGDAGNKAITFTVTRAGNLSQTSSVAWTLTGALDATDLGDGQATSGTINFAASVATGQIVISTRGDLTVEQTEQSTITLSNPQGATLGAPSAATLTLTNDDTALDGGEVAFPATVDTAILPIAAQLVSGQTEYPIVIELSDLGGVRSGDRIWQERRALDGSVVERKSYLLTDADWPSGSGTSPTISLDNAAITIGTHRFLYYLQRGSARSVASNLVLAGPDDIEPVIDIISVNAGSTNATLAFTLDEAATVSFVVDRNQALPSKAQIIGGLDASGTAAEAAASVTLPAGSHELVVTTLTANLAYIAALVAVDTAGNQSDIDTLTFNTVAANAPLAFDPANKSNYATISGGGFVVSCVSGLGESAPARVIREVPIGADVYIELTAGAGAENARTFLGICTAAQVFGASNYFGNAATGTFWIQGNAQYVLLANSTSLRGNGGSNPPAFAGGDVLRMRVRRIDADTVMQSFAVDDGTWTTEFERTMTSCFVWAGTSSDHIATLDATAPYQFAVPAGSGSHP